MSDDKVMIELTDEAIDKAGLMRKPSAMVEITREEYSLLCKRSNSLLEIESLAEVIDARVTGLRLMPIPLPSGSRYEYTVQVASDQLGRLFHLVGPGARI